jgi:isoleucyl-tRNA synthetase
MAYLERLRGVLMKPVDSEVSFPKLEERILKFWEEAKIFEKSMSSDLPRVSGRTPAPRKSYVFYDGPPFATGLPHYGHLLAGTIKDAVGRFFTMKGCQVDRRFGWDCHGLPVEFEIQKALNLHGSKAIEEFGIGAFNEECRKIVLRYTKEWEHFVRRSGRWVDMSRQYRTMDLNFMESVWWALKRLWDRGLVYESVKSVAYSWAASTPLSNFEANLNYQMTQDPAVTCRLKILGDPASRLSIDLGGLPLNAWIWTTTPWTLPSNMALAVNPQLSYSLIKTDSEVAIVAQGLVQKFFGPEGEVAKEFTELKVVKGEALIGLEYEPFFSFFEDKRADNAFRIYSGEFVSDQDGTGIVHCASFGEDDVILFKANNIPIVDPLDADGKFLPPVTDFLGLNFKESDPKVIQELKRSGKLVLHRTIEHSYPFCYRTNTPLLYRAIPTWFVNVEKIRDELVQVNKTVHWVPEHIRDGRFGKWLEGAKDWAISRNRYWGTPVPIWKCDRTGEMLCIGSVEELEKLSGRKVDDLHRHYIDDLTWPSAAGGTMRRVPHVLDCWFESGSMPYAQVHYPFENKEFFEKNFPADFIGEGLDQTRGWFYTLMVLSAALFGRPAFRNVIVNGIVLAEDGKKMSKSLKNYPPPDEVMNEFGADAMRLYLLASAASRGEEIRFSKNGVRDVVRQNLLPLWNAYNFLVTYARVDGWTPKDGSKEPSPNLLDRWIISKVSSLSQEVDKALSFYHLYGAAPGILDFIDQLTNWYIRLNRRRFWAGNTAEERQDKNHAYSTLHFALLTFTRVLAPLAPFISDEIFRNLSAGVEGLEFESVHLAPFPEPGEFHGHAIDPELERAMELFEEVILLGRSLRNDNKLPIRQPLQKITVIHPDKNLIAGISRLEGYIRDELNLKEVEFSTDEAGRVQLKAQLNTKTLGKTLGPKLGSDGMKRLRVAIESLSTEALHEVEAGGIVVCEGIELRAADMLIRREVKGGDAAASSGQITVLLETTLTPELRLEGLAREFVNRVQKMRKDAGFEVTDRIAIRYMSADNRIDYAVTEHRHYIMGETLAIDIESSTSELEMKREAEFLAIQEIDSKTVVVSIKRTLQS